MLLRKEAPVETINPRELPTDDQITPEACMAIAMQAGSILLSSGAETYRVEDTMCVLLRLCGASDYDVNALGTSIMATVMVEDAPPLTQVRRIRRRTLNLTRIAEVNQVSRDLVAHKISLKEAARRMNDLEKPVYGTVEKNVSIIVMICSFALLLSGDLINAFCAVPVAIGVIAVNLLVTFVSIEGFVANLLSSFLGGLAAVLSQRYLFPGASMDIVIAGALMPLFPGTAFTNAIRDIIQGDYISASARAMEAIFTATALAIGVGLALSTFGAYI